MYRSTLDDTAALRANKLDLSVATLQSDLQRFKVAANLLASSRWVEQLVTGDAMSGPTSDVDSQTAYLMIERAAALSGVESVELFSRHGQLVFDSGVTAQPALINPALEGPASGEFNSVIEATRQGRLGLLATGDPSHIVINVAVPVRRAGVYRGAVNLVVSTDELALHLKPSQDLTLFTDSTGVVLLTNRLQMSGLKLPHLSLDARSILRAEEGSNARPQFGSSAESELAFDDEGAAPIVGQRTTGRHAVVTDALMDVATAPFPLPGETGTVFPLSPAMLSQLNVVPENYQLIATPAPELRMMAWSFGSTESAEQAGWLTGILALSTLLGIGAVIRLLIARRTDALNKLADKEGLNVELEKRVSARTAELSIVNRQLVSEIEERKRAEVSLTTTRHILVQAEKLSVLGQLSASISHELNQPLGAIRSYADNARTLIEREDHESANENLGRITDITQRASRILKTLRAFARNEVEPATPVSLTDAVTDALHMLDTRLHDSHVKVALDFPTHAVMVMGGRVRLQQVVTNLVSNAIDAMSESAQRRIDISITTNDQIAKMTVADTGDGIDPDHINKVFDPFHSTKSTPEKQGLGLGLSVVQGIIRGFDGKISVRNRASGGVAFVIVLNLGPGQPQQEQSVNE